MQNANRLRVLRAEKRINQHDTAKAAAISPFCYWQIENGRKTATPDERKALAKVFGVKVADVFPAEASL
jgi:DNA-binding XRE family transcriptional regulator